MIGKLESPNGLEDYINEHTSPEDELLHELYRETHLKIMHPRMLSGAAQGTLLQMLASLISAKRILEIGTYTGYSAICMARGMNPEGELHTIDIKEELYEIAHKYIVKAGFEKQITLHTGNALDIIPKIEGNFDLIFIDADKDNYPEYFKILVDRLHKGGLMITDNVLWSGKVVEPLAENDFDKAGILAFNKMVQEDDRVENVLLPLRDGLMLARKK